MGLAAGIMLVACVAQKSPTATDFLDSAGLAAANGDTVTALALLDSVHSKYPTDVPSRRKADTIEWRITLSQLSNSLPSIASEIAFNDSVVNAMTPKFKFFKDERYEDVGHFEHRLLRTEQGVGRCYLKPTVDEHGNASLASYYVGGEAKHDGFRLEMDSVSVSCMDIPQENISRFDDEGTYHEIMQATAERSSELLEAIAAHSDSRIKVVLVKRSESGVESDGYTYYLTASERKALAECHLLHRSLQGLYRLNDLELRTQQRIDVLNRRLAND